MLRHPTSSHPPPVAALLDDEALDDEALDDAGPPVDALVMPPVPTAPPAPADPSPPP
jgi:hypothetical protein